MEILNIKDLKVETSKDKKEILKNIDLKINSGEVHVVMGPNGSGKSTLINSIMGNPEYVVTKGKLEFLGKDILNLEPDKRAKLGIFMSFQNPVEISGISLSEFLRASKQAVEEREIGVLEFNMELQKEMRKLKIPPEYAARYFNEGFSGGEKKKIEILIMNMLKPKLVMLDETDSGLDIDAIEIVSKNIRENISSENAYIIITHHSEILKEIPVDYVHVLKNGEIIKTGGKEMIQDILKRGFEGIDEE